MRRPIHPLAVLSFLAACCSSANANLVIDPTFDNSITSLTDASTIEAGIDQAISRLENAIETSVTVSIDFGDMSSGLGQSETFFNLLSYSQYRSDLANNQILSANDISALASLPVSSTNPVNQTADVYLTTANLRAIGETALGTLPSGDFDSSITLNLSDMNLSRSGTQDPTKYDLQSVVTHEMDEALGIGGAGSTIGDSISGNPVGSMDLFRYASNGVRSYSTSTSATAYFSINGGATNLSNFNQAGGGSDYGDWATGATPQVQDAFGTPGVDVNLGSNELTSLDVVGYNLVAVPEPGTAFLLMGGLFAIGILKYRRQTPMIPWAWRRA